MAAEKTIVTRALSGREARMVRTQIVDRIERSDVRPISFPAQLSLPRPLQQAASAAGDAEMMFLLAGEGAALARVLPAGDLCEALVAETGPGSLAARRRSKRIASRP